MILVKTDLGLKVMKDRSIPLTGQQRAALILMDGKRSVATIVQTAAAAGVTLDDIRHLVQVGVAQEAPASSMAPTEPAPLHALQGAAQARAARTGT
ncbi:hypothetical protein HHL11_09870 [Ramlibacter sp. G-1-2-2]|uniref:Uncharacterized protein n=1 Tax=Ramlibacter agri TaxID=2728837 RepID=A0A848GZR3_9BURK|nr:hypothetical protein [Ramlibacter agri]NML44055.1 hypothetical protein [Ramlibacter agri]